jgi:hypothetical protein
MALLRAVWWRWRIGFRVGTDVTFVVSFSGLVGGGVGGLVGVGWCGLVGGVSGAVAGAGGGSGVGAGGVVGDRGCRTAGVVVDGGGAW